MGGTRSRTVNGVGQEIRCNTQSCAESEFFSLCVIIIIHAV